jgi:hypothetical protein
VGTRMVNYYVWHHGALFFVSKPNSIIEEMVEYNKRSQSFNIKSKSKSQKCHHRKTIRLCRRGAECNEIDIW